MMKEHETNFPPGTRIQRGSAEKIAKILGLDLDVIREHSRNGTALGVNLDIVGPRIHPQRDPDQMLDLRDQPDWQPDPIVPDGTKHTRVTDPAA
ncbi:Uncharacterized protein PBTT_07045 [Plasmodiophora brassicae]